MKKKPALILICFFFYCVSFAQVKLYEDQFHGGVTGGSFSSGVNGTGSGTIDLYIDPASTIRKAYLIVGRLGPSVPMTVNLNSMVLTFDASNEATPPFNCSLYGGLSAVHAIDISAQVNPAVNSYNISYSQMSNGANFFTDFYLYVAYENNLLPLVSTAVFLKTTDYIATEQYTLNLTYPLDTLVPVSFAMHAGYMCDNNGDGENITVENTLLGLIGGGDPNNPPGLCSGTSGSFYYENNILHGLNGDSADQQMVSSDALSDIKMVVPNGATTLDVQFEHFGGGASSPDNSMWAWIMAYGSSNLLPSALFTAVNHICPGTCTDFNNNSLNATSYQWFFTGGVPSVSTDVNPSTICYSTPGQYPVMLIASNSNGTDTVILPNYITVYPYPAAQGISQNGDTLFANQGAVAYQWYHGGNIIPGATMYYYVAPESGDYNVVVTDANGCEVEAAIFSVVATVSPLSLGEGSGVRLFPNPVGEKFEIHLPGVLSKHALLYQLYIYNILGEKILSLSTEPSTVDVHALTPGIYYLEVIAGEYDLKTKFIKQ
jgi:PKD repeat protein